MEQTFVKTLQKVPICISQSLYPGEKNKKNNTRTRDYVCTYTVLTLDLLMFLLQGLRSTNGVSNPPLCAELLCARTLQPIDNLLTHKT